MNIQNTVWWINTMALIKKSDISIQVRFIAALNIFDAIKQRKNDIYVSSFVCFGISKRYKFPTFIVSSYFF